ncbi:MAG: tRNA uridine-5-carboxymethylaminomethyl(34) synthesis GTPase MnmE [Clostridia bacterium]|nr:tRNA uridine-5-carboxymethylaminomethyl(34) synthesis GTPase MnmE [Clostridia bacterium]
MSGENAFQILEKIFKPKVDQKIEDIKGYTIKYGNIIDDKDIIDEVLVSYFKAPKSYTTENMCEINSHGGAIIVKKILDLCLKNGADLAEPGEFTRRAFTNGRIDLLQAESVIDVINAKTDKEAKAGVKQLEGFLSNEIGKIKQEIMEVMVNIEVTIDYPEYDVDDVTTNQISQMLDSIEIKLRKLENSFDNGKIIKEGIKTAIVGRPNVGKSSLLNAILKEERAIVTEIEGTTRDTIEEFVNINGIPLKLIDTAGIRKTEDLVEKIGVKKTREIAETADLIIVIIDSSKKLTEEDYEILELAKGKKSIIVLNKIDLSPKIDENDIILKEKSNNIIKISALNKTGIEKIYDEITNIFNLNEIDLDNEVIITNLRHKNLISKAIVNVKSTKESIRNNMPIDIIAINIKDILESLGNITGEFVTEDIIDEIFSRFCLGK